MKRLLVGILTAVLCGYHLGAETMTSNDVNSSLTIDEVRPLLDVISRLTPLKVVQPGIPAGSLNMCFIDNPALRGLAATLGRYKGNAAWLLISKLPLVCLVAVPEESMLRSHEIGTQSELRRRILQDVVPLATFLEKELKLDNIPSKGIQVVRSPATVAEGGPGGPALLVADPDQYLSNRFLPTSDQDRTVDFWMSDQELDDLYEMFHPSAGGESTIRDLDILKRVSETTHENLIVIPEEVARLKRQCETMSHVSNRLKGAMLRVISICDLAAPHHLGIVVLGG